MSRPPHARPALARDTFCTTHDYFHSLGSGGSPSALRVNIPSSFRPAAADTAPASGNEFQQRHQLSKPMAPPLNMKLLIAEAATKGAPKTAHVKNQSHIGFDAEKFKLVSTSHASHSFDSLSGTVPNAPTNLRTSGTAANVRSSAGMLACVQTGVKARRVNSADTRSPNFHRTSKREGGLHAQHGGTWAPPLPQQLAKLKKQDPVGYDFASHQNIWGTQNSLYGRNKETKRLVQDAVTDEMRLVGDKRSLLNMVAGKRDAVACSCRATTAPFVGQSTTHATFVNQWFVKPPPTFSRVKVVIPAENAL